MSAMPLLDEQASAWLCERDEGFGPGRAEAFSAWCAADPRHAAAVRQIERAMDLLETMPVVRRPLEARFGPLPSFATESVAVPERNENAVIPETTLSMRSDAAAESSDRHKTERNTSRAIPSPASARRPSVIRTLASTLRSLESQSRSRRALVALVATFVFGVGGSWYYATRVAGREHFLNNATAPQRLVLRDGSIVHLDARSALRVDFSGRERSVRLDSGQAHFEVAHDATRPFVAMAANVAVRAIGTAFTVRIASAAVEVLVEEGRVEVAPATVPSAGNHVPSAPPPQLATGERAIVVRPNADAPHLPQIEKVEPRELREALAWHRRTVVLSDVPLAEALDRFNRRNALQLVLADDTLRDRRLGGVIALDQVEAFVALLERGGDVVAERRNPKEIVLRRAP